ncbi:L,D-transpeptidase [Janibacter alittae]|uniref:Ig-like domain-containing protein n=1 Tax=Janibacter alittae TaxID=3115209 RepID=A0ABZ2ML33_9MICO
MKGTTPAATVVGLLVTAALVLTGCSSGSGSPDPNASSGASTSTSTTPPPAEIEVDPAGGSGDVMPDEKITVHVVRGDLDDVTVVGSGGDEIEGTVQGQTWTSGSRMKPSTEYTVTTTAEGPEGGATTDKTTFTTHDPDVTATYGIVYNGHTVGVGMPVSIQFDSAVTDEKYRRAIEQAVSVETSPRTEGSWGWLDNRQLMWRPKDFWTPGTSVTINAPITGYQTGEDKWVAEDASGSMTIGRRQMATVDIATHEMTVSRGGQTIKSFPVSSGKPGKETETRSGMKVVIGKQREMTMDSSTIGIDKGEKGYYKVDTDYNVRVTWTGEFVHSAPWSVGAQGSTNVSHGCVNMAPQNAKWFYKHSLAGDPVNFTGSDREFKPTEGIGVWQFSWAQWQQQSALA